MDQDIKHNKKKCFGTSIQVLFEAARGAYNKTCICESLPIFAV